MSTDRRKDLIDILNKTWSPCCSRGEKYFTAFGSTPMTDLFKDLDMGHKLDVLLIQQGDLRHIIKTIAAMNHYEDSIEQKSVPDQVMFRFVDSEPANIARNALIFKLLETIDDEVKDIEFIWNVWFNTCLSREHLDRLRSVLGELVNKDCGYDRKWKFADSKSKTKIDKIWNKWICLEKDGVHRETSDKYLFRFEKYSNREPNESRRYATKWPYMKFEHFQKELETWNRHGVLALEGNYIGDAKMANPTMFRNGDVHFCVRPKTCPFATFCPVESADTEIYSTLTETCFTEFIDIIRDAKAMLKRLKVQINFEIGDRLEYLSSHKAKYNLIHTSNLADTRGIANVLLVCEPLLKQTNSVLVTTTEAYCYFTRKDYVRLLMGSSDNLPTTLKPSPIDLPTLLGIQIAENLCLGQNFIGKDSPVQVYRWVKCLEPKPAKISLKDSPGLLNDFRQMFSKIYSHEWSSAMTIATIVKRFQERVTDAEHLLESIVEEIDVLHLKSFTLVCFILGVIPSKSLKVVNITLDATQLGIEKADTDEIGYCDEEAIELFLLENPFKFDITMGDPSDLGYTTDVFCYNPGNNTVTLLMQEKEFKKKSCIMSSYRRKDIKKFPEMIKTKTMKILGDIKVEKSTSGQILVKDNSESYTVTLRYKGKLVDGEPKLIFDPRPCTVSVWFTDSNGKATISVFLRCQITSEFYNIRVDKTNQKIHVTLYKECLQRLGHHLLPLSNLKLEATNEVFEFDGEASAVLDEIKSREELKPKKFVQSYATIFATRVLIERIVLKARWITDGENALNICDISTQQMFLKINAVYDVEGYPVADLTVFNIDDRSKKEEFMQMAVEDGWIFGKESVGAKLNVVFDILKNMLLQNSKRVAQNPKPSIPGSFRSYLDIRFSDFDDKEIPKSKEELMLSVFQGAALHWDTPTYYKCSYCLKWQPEITLLLCGHCDEAFYCGIACRAADYVRHVHTSQFQDNASEQNNRACKSCGLKTSSTKACSKCKEVYYCNRKCQEKDWANHKTSCKAPKKNFQKTTEQQLKKNMVGAFGGKPTNQKPEENFKSSGSSTEYAVVDQNRCKSGKSGVKTGEEHKSKKVTTDSLKIGPAGDFSRSDAEPTNNADLDHVSDTNNNEKQLTSDIENEEVLPEKSPKRRKTVHCHNVDEVKVSSSGTSANAEAKTTGSGSSIASAFQCVNCKWPAVKSMTCNVCSASKYCSFKCQHAHWPEHYKQCIQHLLCKFSEQL